MAFADIKYYGDSGSFGGKASWSGRVSKVSDFDKFDWGSGRKASSSDVKRTIQKIVDQAIKKDSRHSSSMYGTGKRALEKLLSGAERNGNTTVSVKSGTDIATGTETFEVEGQFKTSAIIPFATRIATDSKSGESSLFVRSVGLTSVGRICTVGPEQKVKIDINASGDSVGPLYFVYDEESESITNCVVFCGCFGLKIECPDYSLGERHDGLYYGNVDFSEDEPVLSITKDGGILGQDVISFMVCEIFGGKQTKGVSGPVILPTYS